MKVLHVYKDYFPVLGGIENHLRLLAEEQARLGMEVTVLTTNRSARTTVENMNNVRVVKAGRVATIASAPISLNLFVWMHRLEADITHLHFPYPIGELAYLLSGHNRKMVITYHSDIVRQKQLLQLYRPFLRRVLARAAAITVSSPNYLQTSRFLRPLAAKCSVVPYGVELDRFAPAEAVLSRAEKIRRHYKGPLVLFVGLLRYYKGLSFLIEAMRQVEAKLLVVGEGPQGKEWQNLTRRLGLDRRVTFLNRVSDDELPAFYHACDVFVLPSTHRSEAWGIVQIEAMACGKPVVSTELGTGTSFVNIDGSTGLVVPPRDPAALADAINRLLVDPKLRHRLGENGRKRVRQEFSLQVMVERILQVYRDVAAAS
ncbi:MAG: glycosyltransferase [Candidatus Eisenbacteria bacterium]|nr:glycosyltransferase [Candidatus Eisenbacteria bacterium]